MTLASLMTGAVGGCVTVTFAVARPASWVTVSVAVTSTLNTPATGKDQEINPALLMVMPEGALAKDQVTGLAAVNAIENEMGEPAVPLIDTLETVGAVPVVDVLDPPLSAMKLLALGVPKPVGRS